MHKLIMEGNRQAFSNATFPDTNVSHRARVDIEHPAPWLCANRVRQLHSAHYVLESESLEDIKTEILQRSVLGGRIDDETPKKVIIRHILLK